MTPSPGGAAARGRRGSPAPAPSEALLGRRGKKGARGTGSGRDLVGAASLLDWTEWRLQRAEPDFLKKEDKPQKKNQGLRGKGGPQRRLSPQRARLSACPGSARPSLAALLDPTSLVLPLKLLPALPIPAEGQGPEAGASAGASRGWRCGLGFPNHSPFPWELQAPGIAPQPVPVSLGSHLLLHRACL